MKKEFGEQVNRLSTITLHIDQVTLTERSYVEVIDQKQQYEYNSKCCRTNFSKKLTGEASVKMTNEYYLCSISINGEGFSVGNGGAVFISYSSLFSSGNPAEFG